MKIFCVIVCYNPDVDNLSRICQSLLLSKTNVILVDNTENCFIEDLSQELGVELICFNENHGIAKAQNIGINYAIERNADILVFFDQDSQIDDYFISHLTSPFIANKPMVVSPVFYDKDQGFRFPNYRLNSLGLLKEIKTLNDNEIYSVDMIISSGSAVSREVFDIVGLMNEDYFIDYVDTEWILRCRSKNIPVFVNPKAKMIHAIGEKSIDLRFTRLFVHGPLRSYYKVRNSFLFMKNKNVPFFMGIKEVITALLHNFLIIFFVKEKYKFIKNYFQAVKDGLLNKKGKK
ncbi:glycosyltransferase family 2 protein [Flavobacterium sp. DG2-3]|uniref:glycosyltransferase family 2 protein n=1 Tax=Flavobacterium sp. DG2-3 TaxID=3068317 RepID=UPI00273DF78A|nr:glycosyltransferase family 2 protein [Flavobacterium sp. DG2-3]MDP5200711.1 glycosyltransferase family 2 protein [Flavobacterium sp. DG2-3]